MTIPLFFQSPQITLYNGHCLDVLKKLPSNSIHCVCTSPPYFGLRHYHTSPQTWGGSANCEHDWESQRYYREGGATGIPKELFTSSGSNNARRIKETRWREATSCRKCGAWWGELGAEPTLQGYVNHLVEVFTEVRRVLRSDGTCWVNLGDCFAAKGQPGRSNLAELGKQYAGGGHKRDQLDKPQKQLPAGFKPKDLLMVPHRVAIALQESGWWVRSDIVWHKPNCLPESVTDRPTRAHEYIFMLTKGRRYYYNAEAIREAVELPQTGLSANFKRHNSKRSKNLPGQSRATHPPDRAETFSNPRGRNKRSVWNIPTVPFAGAHCAAFPPKLIVPCILASCSPDGIVLDIFAGSGTTLQVAQEFGRKAIGIELNPDYCKIAAQRCQQTTIWGALMEVALHEGNRQFQV